MRSLRNLLFLGLGILIAIFMGFMGKNAHPVKEVEEPVIQERVDLLAMYDSIYPTFLPKKFRGEIPTKKEEKVVLVASRESVMYGMHCEQYREIFERYPWPVDVALRVCEAESNGNPNAVGDGHIPPVSCGLMQIRTLPGRPSCEALKDPEFNIQYAYDMWSRKGWRPWSVCSNGRTYC
jgi:hypothetical protein